MVQPPAVQRELDVLGLDEERVLRDAVGGHMVVDEEQGPHAS
jgi:hypothetical protein